MLGDRLLADSVNLSPVLTAGWAGLIVNALNCLPFGGSHGNLSYFYIVIRSITSSSTAIVFSAILA